MDAELRQEIQELHGKLDRMMTLAAKLKADAKEMDRHVIFVMRRQLKTQFS